MFYAHLECAFLLIIYVAWWASCWGIQGFSLDTSSAMISPKIWVVEDLMMLCTFWVQDYSCMLEYCRLDVSNVWCIFVISLLNNQSSKISLICLISLKIGNMLCLKYLTLEVWLIIWLIYTTGVRPRAKSLSCRHTEMGKSNKPAKWFNAVKKAFRSPSKEKHSHRHSVWVNDYSQQSPVEIKELHSAKFNDHFFWTYFLASWSVSVLVI